MAMRIAPLVLLLLVGKAVGDEVTLKNGDRVSGKVVRLAGGRLVVETPHSGTVAIDWAQVASVKTEGKVAVRLETNEVLDGRLEAGAEGRLRVLSEGAAQPVEVEMGRVKFFNEPPTEWHGAIDAAGRKTDGNTHNQGFIVAGEASRATESDLFSVRTIFRYSETGGFITERSAYGMAKYQYRFTERLYGYGSVELLSDKFKDLSLGTTLSAGAGHDLLRGELLDFSAEAGIAYFDNNRRAGLDESHPGARVSAKARLALPLGFELAELFTWYPNFEEASDWQIRNEGSVSKAVGGGWTFRAGVISEIDNEPPAGLERYDNTYFVGLGYRF